MRDKACCYTKKVRKACWKAAIGVPGEILVAFVAKLRLYGFWVVKVLFAEFLGILEKASAPDFGGAPSVSRVVGKGPGERSCVGTQGYF